MPRQVAKDAGVERQTAGKHSATEVGSGSAGLSETLSAMFDDEAQELELRRLLRDLQRQGAASAEAGEVRGQWQRLQLTRSVMRGEPVYRNLDLSAAVRDAIEADAPLGAGARPGWRRALGSFAVAASVTAVVVLGGQQLTLGQGAVELARVAPLPVGVVNTRGAMPVQASYGTRALPTLEPANRTAYRELARQRLRLYSQEHAEHASLNTPQGMLPFARVPVIEQ